LNSNRIIREFSISRSILLPRMVWLSPRRINVYGECLSPAVGGPPHGFDRLHNRRHHSIQSNMHRDDRVAITRRGRAAAVVEMDPGAHAAADRAVAAPGRIPLAWACAAIVLKLAWACAALAAPSPRKRDPSRARSCPPPVSLPLRVALQKSNACGVRNEKPV
jgi:hypothetical protein